ncbi:uncharacterized protein UV8b_04311 [Ustilaginoidea virens]|uniref:Uncharacterized protein n=1 Tax=Ustilaginoidea virens TaxID=1159556 RepID=A0A8E5HRJ8_USTVR|nr:uncharacterized protein UV8b_04311 [Ustilaginoidea virens]QUC20070.1 hypothetical protein UV8b_04311 [Ustilaginoidea virens]
MKTSIISKRFFPAVLLGESFLRVSSLSLAIRPKSDPGLDYRFSGIAPSQRPPDYQAPTYGYENPPPYQYDTSTLTTTDISKSSSTPPDVIYTIITIVTDQSSSTSKRSLSSIDPYMPYSSSTSVSRSWPQSSILGVTGTSASDESTFASSTATLGLATETASSLSWSTVSKSASKGVPPEDTSWAASITSSVTQTPTATNTKDMSSVGSSASSLPSSESSEPAITSGSSHQGNTGPTSVITPTQTLTETVSVVSPSSPLESSETLSPKSGKHTIRSPSDENIDQADRDKFALQPLDSCRLSKYTFVRSPNCD